MQADIRKTERCTVWKVPAIDETMLQANTEKYKQAIEHNKQPYILMQGKGEEDITEDPEHLIIHYKTTLTLPDPVTIRGITTAKAYNLTMRKTWTMPRPFDEEKTEPRYIHLIENLTQEEQVATLRKWAQMAHRSYLLPGTQDTAIQILLHCLPIGNKRTGGPNSIPHCQHPHCRHKKPEENCIHLFTECKAARDAMSHIIEKWKIRTNEEICNKDIVTRLFGDRKILSDEMRPELEEPFHTIQATLNAVIWRARCKYVHKEIKQPYTAKSLVRSTTVALNKHLPTRMMQLRNQNKLA